MNRVILFLILPFLLFSCTQDEPFPNTKHEVNPALATNNDENEVTYTDLDNFVKRFKPSGSRSNGYTLSTINNEAGEPAIYILNFDEGGWALISATKKYQPLLAFNDEGSFTINESMPGGVKLWKDAMVEYISKVEDILPEDSIAGFKSEWNAISPNPSPGPISPQVDHYIDSPFFHSDFTQEDYKRLRGIMADSIANWEAQGCRVETFDNLRYGELIPGPYGDQGYTINDILRMCDGMPYIFYCENFRFISCAVYSEKDFYEETGPYIESKWGQDFPFNTACPIIDYQNSLAGCGPVAVGQLMRYLQHPSKYAWGSMPLTFTPTFGLGVVPEFLYEIGTEMGTEYGLTASSTLVNDEISFLQKYYSFETARKIDNSKLPNFINGQLAFISASWDNGKYEHAWLSGGHWSHQRYTSNKIYTFILPDEMQSCGNMEQETWYPKTKVYYMNWGYAGQYDGYYASSGWSLPGSGSKNAPEAIRIFYNFLRK